MRVARLGVPVRNIDSNCDGPVLVTSAADPPLSGAAEARNATILRKLVEQRVGVEEVQICAESDDVSLMSLEAPAAGDESRAYALTIAGRILLEEDVVESVEAMLGDDVIRATKLNVPTPRLAADHPTAIGAEMCGFRLPLSMVAVPRRFDLRVRATTRKGRHVDVATLRRLACPLRVRIRTEDPAAVRHHAWPHRLQLARSDPRATSGNHRLPSVPVRAARVELLVRRFPSARAAEQLSAVDRSRASTKGRGGSVTSAGRRFPYRPLNPT